MLEKPRWRTFFLRGVFDTAQLASVTARKLLRLFEEDRARLQKLNRGAGSALRVQHYLQADPIAAAADIAKALELSKTATHSALGRLQKFALCGR